MPPTLRLLPSTQTSLIDHFRNVLLVLGGFLISVNLDNASFERPFAELPVLNQDFTGQLHYVPGSKSGRSQRFSHIQSNYAIS